jgi:hypothetical protein
LAISQLLPDPLEDLADLAHASAVAAVAQTGVILRVFDELRIAGRLGKRR